MVWLRGGFIVDGRQKIAKASGECRAERERSSLNMTSGQDLTMREAGAQQRDREKEVEWKRYRDREILRGREGGHRENT